MVKISDIAAAMNLSSATISNAITGKGRMKEETRQLILEQAAAMGYPIVAPHLKQLKKTIVIVEEHRIPLCATIVSGVNQAAAEAGCRLPAFDLQITDRMHERNADAALLRPMIDQILRDQSSQPAGLIYISQYPRKIPGLFNGLNIPVVEVLSYESGASYSYDYNNQQGAYLAVTHLIDQGKKKIAMLSGPVDTPVVSERMIGYQRSLIDHGLPFHPKMVWIGDWEIQSGYELTKSLLASSTPPDAIFAQNDTMAYGAAKAVLEAGLAIPGDVAISGFDNSEICNYTEPTLTSVSTPLATMGYAAFKKMEALLKGESLSAPNRELLPCELAIRQSSALV